MASKVTSKVTLTISTKSTVHITELQQRLSDITQAIGRVNRPFTPTISPLGYTATSEEKASLDTLKELTGDIWSVTLGLSEHGNTFSHIAKSKRQGMKIMKTLKNHGIRSKYERLYTTNNVIIYISLYRVMKAVNPNLITGYELGIT